MTSEVEAAKARLAAAHEQVREAEAAYSEALAAEAEAAYAAALSDDDEVTQVAFLLYQRSVSREAGWEGPVTWRHWHDLQIDSERDGWRAFAAEVLDLVREMR